MKAQERSTWQCLPHPGHSLLQRNSMTIHSNRCLQGTQSVDFRLLFLTDQKSLIEYIFEFFITIKNSGSGKDVRSFKKSFYGEAVK